jgi:ABC-2 type transport system ATP-binding protein
VTAPTVALEGVTMQYRGHTALTDVTTSFRAGTITGLLGRNGAAKTTLMQLSTGHRVPSSRSVRVFGETPFETDSLLARTVFIRESQRYPDHFRVQEAVAAAAGLFPNWDANLAADLLADFEQTSSEHYGGCALVHYGGSAPCRTAILRAAGTCRRAPAG